MSRSKTWLRVALTSALLVSLSGCYSLNKNSYSQVLLRTEALVEPELEIGPEIEGTHEMSVLFNCFNIGSPEKKADNTAGGGGGGGGFLFFGGGAGPDELAKKGAAFNAMEQGGFDYIVGAQYTIEQTNYFVFKTIKATVKGYGAKVKSVSQVKLQP